MDNIVGVIHAKDLLQFLADIVNVPVERPVNVESTVLGAAFLAGLRSGVFESVDAIANLWASDRVFEPQMADEKRNELYRGWQDAVSRVRVSG